jgi:pyruvate kinase
MAQPDQGKVRQARTQGQDPRHGGAGEPLAGNAEKLFRAGADAFRVNMSHGEHAIHA